MNTEEILFLMFKVILFALTIFAMIYIISRIIL